MLEIWKYVERKKGSINGIQIIIKLKFHASIIIIIMWWKKLDNNAYRKSSLMKSLRWKNNIKFSIFFYTLVFAYWCWFVGFFHLSIYIYMNVNNSLFWMMENIIIFIFFLLQFGSCKNQFSSHTYSIISPNVIWLCSVVWISHHL
jgi:membrane-associated HD superfamily phosphohydrolase